MVKRIVAVLMLSSVPAMAQMRVAAKTGDVIDGHRLLRFGRVVSDMNSVGWEPAPMQLTDDGVPVFRAIDEKLVEGVYTPTRVVAFNGAKVAGVTIREVRLVRAGKGIAWVASFVRAGNCVDCADVGVFVDDRLVLNLASGGIQDVAIDAIGTVYSLAQFGDRTVIYRNEKEWMTPGVVVGQCRVEMFLFGMVMSQESKLGMPVLCSRPGSAARRIGLDTFYAVVVDRAVFEPKGNLIGISSDGRPIWRSVTHAVGVLDAGSTAWLKVGETVIFSGEWRMRSAALNEMNFAVRSLPVNGGPDADAVLASAGGVRVTGASLTGVSGIEGNGELVNDRPAINRRGEVAFKVRSGGTQYVVVASPGVNGAREAAPEEVVRPQSPAVTPPVTAPPPDKPGQKSTADKLKDAAEKLRKYWPKGIWR